MTASSALLLLGLIAGGAHALKAKEPTSDQSLLETESQTATQKILFQESIWNYIDRNKDGFLSLDDLKKSMHFGDTAELLMDIADRDKDHKLSKLEFFGTVEGSKTKGDKVKGDAGSGPVGWENRDFDEFLDNADKKYPELCSKKFWEWAATEYKQRRVLESSNKAVKVDKADLYQNGLRQVDRVFKEQGHLLKYLAPRGMSHLGHNVLTNPKNAFAASGSNGWDICLQLLPIQKRLKMKKADFDKWQRCYQHDLYKISNKGGWTKNGFDGWTNVGLGLPKNVADRNAVAQFYTDYHVGEKKECGMTDSEKAWEDKKDKWGKGCYSHMPCWTNPDQWLKQANDPNEPNNPPYTSPIAVKRNALRPDNPIPMNPFEEGGR